MNNREIAQKIYEKLLEKGAGIGNASIPIIEKVLDESSQFEPLVIVQEAEEKQNTHNMDIIHLGCCTKWWWYKFY